MTRRLLSLAVVSLLVTACGRGEDASSELAATPATPAVEEKVLNIYNWSDYIAPDTLANFEMETGIKINYDVFDSNEVLEAKLLAGGTGYDIVVPSLTFLSRQIQADVFQPIDRSQIGNFGNLDPAMLAEIARKDAGNTFGVPYLWGTTGIGYNEAKVREALGADAPVDSWALVLEPTNLSKLHSCGVAFLDSPTEIIPAVLRYLGEDPNSFDPALIQQAVDRLMQLRPYVTYFHSSKYINDLANGDLCVVIGWSGDVLQAASRAEEAGRGVVVRYVIPKEGASMWVDMMAIPKDAPNAGNAHLFLNYLLRPEVKAGITNYVTFANANLAADPLVDEAVRNHPGVYPTPEARAKLYTLTVLPPEVDRLFTRHWTTVKTGQ